MTLTPKPRKGYFAMDTLNSKLDPTVLADSQLELWDRLDHEPNFENGTKLLFGKVADHHKDFNRQTSPRAPDNDEVQDEMERRGLK